MVNVGVIGRPANDGNTHVWYAMLEARERGPAASSWCRSPTTTRRSPPRCGAEGLPEEFVETILTGWWTTCLEILPARERAASRF